MWVMTRRLRRFDMARPSRVNGFTIPLLRVLKRPEGRAPAQARCADFICRQFGRIFKDAFAAIEGYGGARGN